MKNEQTIASQQRRLREIEDRLKSSLSVSEAERKAWLKAVIDGAYRRRRFQ